jgi:S1-C subfamily serine protease
VPALTYLLLLLAASDSGWHRRVAQAPQPTPLRVLNIVAGPSGSESKGIFVLNEQRSVFNRADDREVIVYFQWEGTPGTHKLAAHWRSPDGSLSSTSTFDYNAQDRRFGAYWRQTLSPSMPLGTWSIEAAVDGQPAGRFTFEITDTKLQPAVVKTPLTQAELYDRLNHVFVVLRRSTSVGRELEPPAAVAGAQGRIFTSMAAVDEADRIVANFSGSSREVTTLVAWNRAQDWAVLEGSAATDQPLPVASPTATRVGDRCFSMEGGATGGRVLVDGNITGEGGRTSAVPTLLVTFLNGTGTPGAPLLNEFGELIGIVGGSNVPGASRMMHLIRFRSELKGVPIVPFTLVRAREDAAPVALAELRARGVLVPSLEGEEHIVSGGFARSIKKTPMIIPSDQREEFSVTEKTFVAFVNWNPQQRLKGETALFVFDSTNRVIAQSKVAKADMRKGQPALTVWELAVPSPGTYRADVVLNGKPVWRGFVRINP